MPANHSPRLPATRTRRPRPAPDNIVGWHVYGPAKVAGYYAWDGYRYRRRIRRVGHRVIREERETLELLKEWGD